MVEGVYYFHAHYGYDNGTDWEEKDNYGFIAAEGFICATQQIVDYYRDDLISFSIEEIGDTLVCVDDKNIAEAFKESYLKTHYGENEND